VAAQRNQTAHDLTPVFSSTSGRRRTLGAAFPDERARVGVEGHWRLPAPPVTPARATPRDRHTTRNLGR
jgi:hypothetical protein